MDQVLGALGKVPLDVTCESRAVVEYAEGKWRGPFAARGEDPVRAMMVVQVPEGVDMLGFVAPHFALLETFLGAARTLGVAGRETASFEETLRAKEAAYRGVGR